LSADQAQPTLICFPYAQVRLKHPRGLNNEFTIGRTAQMSVFARRSL
jgi:hypothetical protein